MTKKDIGIFGEIEIEVIGKNGKIISYHKQPLNSLVDNMATILYALLTGQWLRNLYQTSGSTSNSIQFSVSQIIAPSGNHNYGIMVGSSDETWDNDDYNLKAKILNGSGNGQLLYSADNPSGSINFNSMEKSYSFSSFRLFTNVSGSPITIKEIGYACRTAQADLFYLINRDVLTSPVSVPNDATVRVKYFYKLIA